MGSPEIEDIPIYDIQCLPQTRRDGLIFLKICHHRSVKFDLFDISLMTNARACLCRGLTLGSRTRLLPIATDPFAQQEVESCGTAAPADRFSPALTSQRKLCASTPWLAMFEFRYCTDASEQCCAIWG